MFLESGIYNVNWIEESGLVVSQIADLKNGKVYAFMTWSDEITLTILHYFFTNFSCIFYLYMLK